MQACPICRRPLAFASQEEARRVRPFCSARCKLIDLGNWASEDYRVASTERIQDESFLAAPSVRAPGDGEPSE